jgi:hypothetical protein|nr:MAG TPA: hypothetical protein [Caudoviricetes sp.]
MKSFYYLGSIITVSSDVNYVSLSDDGIKCHKERPQYDANINDYISKDSYKVKVDYFRKSIGIKDSLLLVENTSSKLDILSYFAINKMKEALLKCFLFETTDTFFDYLEKHSSMTPNILSYLKNLTKVITINGVSYRVKKSIKYVAYDKNGAIYAFTHKPEKREKEWVATKGETVCLSEYYSNWEASLIEV